MLNSQLGATNTLAAGRYRIDPDRSRVRYSGRHMFGLGTVHATFSIREGVLIVGDDAGGLSSSVTVDASSFWSDSTRRDRDVRSAGLLDVEHYPDITFASERMLETPGEGWLVPGTVTARGRSVPVDVQVDRVTSRGREVIVHGWARHLDRTSSESPDHGEWWAATSTWSSRSLCDARLIGPSNVAE